MAISSQQSVVARGRVCVTGGAGFVAGHLVNELLTRGYEVRATLRDLSRADKRTHLDTLAERYPGRLSLHQADMLEAGALDEALSGCDALIHTAATVQMGAKDPKRQIYDVAVEGTENVLASVERTPSVRRVVMTSSIAAIMSYGQSKRRFSEADWCQDKDMRANPYGMAKTESERRLWTFAERNAERLHAVAINPGYVVGEPLARHHVDASISVLRDLISGRLPAVPAFHFSLVDVGDVALAHAEALRSEKAVGQRILVTDAELSMLELAELLSKHFRTPRARMPNWMMYVGAWLDPRMSVAAARVLVDFQYGFDSQRAEELLGLRLSDARASAVRGARSMVERGWVRARPVPG